MMAAVIYRGTWSQRIGALFGAVYVLVGVVGFAVTSGVGFAALRGKDLILFELNPLHNIVHLAIGVALISAAVVSPAASRLTNRLVGGTYLLVAVVGTILVEADTSLFRGLAETRHELNILALNHPDNLLHLASALVLVGSTLVGSRRAPATGEAEDAEEAPVPVAAERSSRPGLLWAGEPAPKTGTYRCACGQFAVAIRQGRELPDCPEPTGTDSDHYFRIQRKPAAKRASAGRSGSGARRSGRPTGTASRR
jgi:hypothetical protein